MSGADPRLESDERARYSRHLLLPQVGVEGQTRLKGSRVLIVGVGGLGCPAAQYLAMAGIGRLGLVDDDVVDSSNLQRQPLFTTADVGQPKVEAAEAALRAINPHVTIDARQERVDERNAGGWIEDYDLVLDGSDSIRTRNALNTECVAQGKPYVYGSVYQFEGQVSVFGVGEGPCYACLFPDATDDDVCSCNEGGVLGVMPGIIGTLQAAEALKLALGAGDVLGGKLLVCRLLDMGFETYRVPRNPDCPVCSSTGRPHRIEHGAPAARTAAAITPETLRERMQRGEALTLVDLRAPHESVLDPLPGAMVLSLEQLLRDPARIPSDRPVVLYCLRGFRSLHAVPILKQLGFRDVSHLDGGLHGWVRTP